MHRMAETTVPLETDRWGDGDDPVRLPKAADLVAARLRRQIVRGELNEGEELPPEPQLLKILGVGRPALREALRMLESEGLIRVRRGSKGGATVHLPNRRIAARSAGLLLQVAGATLEDVYETRLLLEPVAARMVAEKGTKRAHAALRKAYEDEAAVLTRPAAFGHMSAAFHHKLVELAGLKTLGLIADLLADITDRFTVDSLRTSADPDDVLRAQIRRAYRAHGHLVELVEAKDGDGAERYWREHMEAAGKLMLRDGRGNAVIDLLE